MTTSFLLFSFSPQSTHPTTGHDVIAVIGTATARLGDPPGHFTDRKKIPDVEIDRNALKIAENIRYVFENHANDVYENRKVKEMPMLKVLFNYDWYKQMDPIKLISEVFSQYKNKDLQSLFCCDVVDFVKFSCFS